MRLSFIQLGTFVADWRSLRLDDDDLRALEMMLLDNPDRGQVMSGTGGLRKLRFAPPSRHSGKSGGMRVGYIHLPGDGLIVFVLIFSKNEKANLTSAERVQTKTLMERLKRSLNARRNGP